MHTILLNTKYDNYPQCSFFFVVMWSGRLDQKASQVTNASKQTLFIRSKQNLQYIKHKDKCLH